MLAAIAHGIFLFAFPLLAILLTRRYRAFEIVGTVVMSYIGGILYAALLGVGNQAWLSPGTAKTVSEAVIPISIPLLVFSTDFHAWLRYARTTAISFGLATLSVAVAACVAFLVLGKMIPDAHKVSGMLVGVYTGGTPNLAAIGLALDVSQHSYLLINAADVLLGGLYFLFLLTAAKPLLGRLLPAFEGDRGMEQPRAEASNALHFEWHTVRGMLLGLGLAVLVVGLSAAISLGYTRLVDGVAKISVPIVMLGITAPAVALSFLRPVRLLPGTYPLGEYLILVFCVAIGTQVDATQLFTQGLDYLGYSSFVMLGAILLHFGLAAVFRIDRDTTIITSTAAIYGPAFVGPIADHLKNKTILLSGLTAGLVGYAIGNYVGIGVATLLAGLG